MSTDAPAADRYARLIRSMLETAPTFIAQTESPAHLQVERGLALVGAMRGTPPVQPSIETFAQLSRPIATGSLLDVVDRAGHRRPVYRPLLVYAMCRAITIGQVALSDTVRGTMLAWLELAEYELSRAVQPIWGDGPIPAARGAQTALALWCALALHAGAEALADDRSAGRRAMGKNLIDAVALRQTAEGLFLAPSGSDNPETHWYHELLILHAVTSLACRSRDPRLLSASATAADYHLIETQPDHASGQPWALAAFARHAPAHPLADQILHAAGTLGRSPLAFILLADALYCLTYEQPG